jgi:MFS family permease
LSEEPNSGGASPDDAPGAPAQPEESPAGAEGEPSRQSYAGRPTIWRRWGWPLLVAALAVLGVLLAIADTALYGPALSPYARFLIGPSAVVGVPRPSPDPERFVRARLPERITLAAPFDRLGTVSPLQALRAFLSNGAGLVLIALAVLLLFPGRARVAVERLEGRHGPEIALAAGVATFLLGLGVVALLRFTLIFLAVIPALLIVALAVALFGIACIGLALGRLLQRRLGLGPSHPLLAALVGALVVFDLAVVPYLGAVALAAVAVGGLGLAVVTRFGSETGWSFRDLDW